jgi:23S rRNA (uracil1939-C5)-methyltransferase
MLSPGQTVQLRVEKPAVGGRMIARVDGQIVFVGGAIPGERVTATIERVAKGLAYAQTIAVDEPSPSRRPATSDPLCGGCLYAHIAYDHQRHIKSLIVADAFARIARLDLPAEVDVAPSPEEGYRMRARLHVRGGRIGFFREGTHDLCDPRQTGQLLAASCDVLDRVSAGLRSLRIEQAVREIELSENVDASQRVVHVDLVSPVDARALAKAMSGEGLTPGPHVTDTLTIDGHAIRLQRHVLAFFQGNRYLLRNLVAHVVSQVPTGASVIDLYAGAGLFSVSSSAARSARVTAVEGDRFAAADLKANVLAAGGSVDVVHAPVETFVARARGARATMIVDPPRTGMSREAVEGVIALDPSRVVYVSCDVATLARDARRFVDAGYRIGRIDAFDMFPNTPHVETVIVMDRASSYGT